ncbi:MAG: hypothetical protein I4O51_05540 [Flavobacterium micromati]|nr:hypothetical protein [Flavobacterium micromati]
MNKFIFAFLSIILFVSANAQNRGIHLISKEVNKQEYLAEHRRIKVKLNSGQSIAGQFSIVDNQTISIKGLEIKLDSIVKIKKASRFSAIANPILLGTGSLIFISGAGLLIQGGFGATLAIIPLLYGSALLISPVSKKKYRTEKWTYRIGD